MERSQRLYKFRALTRGNLAFVSRIFTHHELYLPSAPELNDPWECRPLVRTGPEGWTILVYDGFHEVSPSDLGIWPGKLGHAADRESGLVDSFHTPDERRIAQQQLNRIKSQLGTPNTAFWDLYHASPHLRLCSFSRACTHPLLWSHYADSHRGIAIEFDASCAAFNESQAVVYQSEYPVFSDVSRHFNLHQLERASLLVKSKIWEYEEESRLISSPRGQPEESLVGVDHIYRFPAEALTGVIFGCQASAEARALVREWLGEHARGVRFTQAKLHPTRFELEFVPCT